AVDGSEIVGGVWNSVVSSSTESSSGGIDGVLVPEDSRGVLVSGDGKTSSDDPRTTSGAATTTGPGRGLTA
ncbi:unnamed protein product, partial [Ixodes persulcatus]